MIESLQE
jgi:hypothetical protein